MWLDLKNQASTCQDPSSCTSYRPVLLKRPLLRLPAIKATGLLRRELGDWTENLPSLRFTHKRKSVNLWVLEDREREPILCRGECMCEITQWLQKIRLTNLSKECTRSIWVNPKTPTIRPRIRKRKQNHRRKIIKMRQFRRKISQKRPKLRKYPWQISPSKLVDPIRDLQEKSRQIKGPVYSVVKILQMSKKYTHPHIKSSKGPTSKKSNFWMYTRFYANLCAFQAISTSGTQIIIDSVSLLVLVLADLTTDIWAENWLVSRYQLAIRDSRVTTNNLIWFLKK